MIWWSSWSAKRLQWECVYALKINVPSLTCFHRIFRGTLDWVATAALSVWQTADSITEVLEAYRTIKRDFRKSDSVTGRELWGEISLHFMFFELKILYERAIRAIRSYLGVAGKHIRWVCERDKQPNALIDLNAILQAGSRTQILGRVRL